MQSYAIICDMNDKLHSFQITGLSKKSASATSSAKKDKQYAEFEGDKLGETSNLEII